MILVTGATGNVGSAIIDILLAKKMPVKAAIRNKASAESGRRGLPSDICVELDFERPNTFQDALKGVSRIFLMRPPAIADVTKGIGPFIKAAKQAGVRQIVFLSLLGVEKNRVVPHRKIEDLILASGIPYTFLRPSFFMQNLITTHRAEITDLNEIVVPAGGGRTSFIDVRDIAEVAALVMTEPGHENRAYPLTGSEALTYEEVAQILSQELSRNILYRNPSIIRFVRHQRKNRTPWAFIGVMVGIYAVAKLGLAGTITRDTEKLLRRKPITFRQFAKDHVTRWNHS